MVPLSIEPVEENLPSSATVQSIGYLGAPAHVGLWVQIQGAHGLDRSIRFTADEAQHVAVGLIESAKEIIGSGVRNV